MFNWKPFTKVRLGEIMDTSNRDGADPETTIGSGPDYEPHQKMKVHAEPVNPEPDLSTKPVDKVGYTFGYVCSKKHINDTFDSVTVEGYNIRKPCQTCGLLARPAIIKQTAEAKWVRGYGYSGMMWVWRQSYVSEVSSKLITVWTKKEFVRFLTTKGEQNV